MTESKSQYTTLSLKISLIFVVIRKNYTLTHCLKTVHIQIWVCVRDGVGVQLLNFKPVTFLGPSRFSAVYKIDKETVKTRLVWQVVIEIMRTRFEKSYTYSNLKVPNCSECCKVLKCWGNDVVICARQWLVGTDCLLFYTTTLGWRFFFILILLHQNCSL